VILAAFISDITKYNTTKAWKTPVYHSKAILVIFVNNVSKQKKVLGLNIFYLIYLHYDEQYIHNTFGNGQKAMKAYECPVPV
jgi:hypothetical protein